MTLTIDGYCSDFAKRIDGIDWFANIGEPPSKYSGPFQIAHVKSLSDLYAELKSDAWCNVDLVAFNKLCWNVRRYISVEAECYTNTLAEAASGLYSRLESSIAQHCKEHGLRSDVKAEVRSMLIRACQEGYFVALESSIRCDFFTNLLDIFRMGYLPCGWQGQVVEPLYDPFTFAGDALTNESDSIPFDYHSGTLLIY